MALCCILFAGCETAKPALKIKSVADTSYTGAVKKLFIVINLPPIGWEQTAPGQQEEERSIANQELFRHTITGRFEELNIETESEIITGREPNDFLLKQKIAEFNGDAVYTIHAVSYNTKANLLHEIIFDVSIFDEKSQKRIWKANWIFTTADPDTGAVKADGKSIADNLFAIVTDQLKADGMKIFGR